jgi:transcriptional regulator with XRE-family HTH domain
MVTGSFFANRRKVLGLSQVALAVQAGISLPTLQNIEADKANPSWDIMHKLCLALDFDLQISSRPIDWGVLAYIGFALAAEQTQKTDLNPLKTQLELKKALYQLTENNLSLREKETLLAFMLALQSHFPSIFKKYEYLLSESQLIKELKKVNMGRIIKLRRISLSTLKKEYL